MIFSIPHTGTKFIQHVVRCSGTGINYLHIYHNSGQEQILDLIQRKEKIVIPIRDPATNMLSHYARGNPCNRNTWVRLAKSWKFLIELEHDSVFFFPLELEYTTLERVKLLESLINHLELPKHNFILQDIAIKWPCINPSTDTEAKQAYRDGRLQEVEPELWQVLTEMTQVAAWIKKRGYNISWG